MEDKITAAEFRGMVLEKLNNLESKTNSIDSHLEKQNSKVFKNREDIIVIKTRWITAMILLNLLAVTLGAFGLFK